MSRLIPGFSAHFSGQISRRDFLKKLVATAASGSAPGKDKLVATPVRKVAEKIKDTFNDKIKETLTEGLPEKLVNKTGRLSTFEARQLARKYPACAKQLGKVIKVSDVEIQMPWNPLRWGSFLKDLANAIKN